MTAIERLRALEKAVELVAKATKGPWAFMNEKFDDCLLAFGTDSLEYDAPPPWYSCWTNINPDDGRALIAAVNFIREHGSALIAELGQEVGAVAPLAMRIVLPRGSTTGWESYDAERAANLSKGWTVELAYSSPAHTSEARDAEVTDELVEMVAEEFHGWHDGSNLHDAISIALRKGLAAMRQEAE